MLVPIVFGCGPFPSVQTVVLIGFFGNDDVCAEGGGFEGRHAAGTSSLSEPVGCRANSRDLEE